MKYFPEFYRILERFHEPRIETVDREFRAKKKSKEFQLYDGIGNGLLQNDTAAAGTLYPQARADAPKYSTLKNRLKVRMLNSFFHLNLKRAGFSDAAQAFYIANRRMFLVKMLIGMGARLSAARMAEMTLELAQRFELTNIALEMARLLREHASVMGHFKKFRIYNELIKEYTEKYISELASEEYRHRIIMVFNRKSGGRSRYVKEFTGYDVDLRSRLNEKSSYNFRLNYHYVVAMTSAATGNHADIIQTSKEGLSFLDSVPLLLQKERKGDFWFRQLQSYIGMHDYEGAEQAANECATFYNPGSNAWFAYAEAKFLLFTNTLKIHEANALLTEVMNHTRFPQQSELSREHWEIFKFYLMLALKSQPGYDPQLYPHKFNFAMFELKVMEARKDKEGMNMLIRIAHIIHLVENGKYNEADNAVAALADYRRRHIQASMTPRSSLFMQLLRTMVKYSYSYKACLSKGKKTYERLQTEKFEIVDIEQEIQVLPWPWLWDRLIEQMKANEEKMASRYR